MTFLSILHTLILSPLELLFEVIFTIANRVIDNAGLSIVFLSIAINFLVLPLYKRADELQAEERDIQAKMAYRIKRTKQTFKGDERFMMLQEYYRINNYKPIYVLKSSVSLLLQIPFFIAAYRVLSGMDCLRNASFLFISDLGKEDATFMIGDFPVNILPILMTLINIASGIIYTKGHPLKEKIQVYGLAAVFLVFLYHSPAGLVFYWLLNNVFSLVKNIFYKLKNPRMALNIVLAAAAVAGIVLALTAPDFTTRRKCLVTAGCILLTLPLASSLIKKAVPPKRRKTDNTFNGKKIFFAGTILMALITGLLIPSSVINASVEEFVDVSNPSSPALYVINTFLLALGCWVLWGGIFYFFMSEKIREVFSKAIWIICGVSVLDYMLFGTDLGTISSTLQFDIAPAFGLKVCLINLLAIIAVAALFYFLASGFRKMVTPVLLIGILAVLGVGIYSTVNICIDYNKNHNYEFSGSDKPVIPLSKDGKNVVVLMLDRSMGSLVPYILNEKPSLKEKFDGFTYYPNTISYGAHTIFAAPALFGGYEYTPENMNARTDMHLVDKHNEALKVMPVLFSNNGYTVTVCDPPHASYRNTPDLSIYDEYPDFNCYNTDGEFDLDETNFVAGNTSGRIDEIRNRNFFFYSLMKIAPLALQDTIYNGGIYNESSKVNVRVDTPVGTASLVQNLTSTRTSEGYDKSFLDAYAVLTNLPSITEISDGSDNTFMMMGNKTTHAACLLQEPNYVPAIKVDNTLYDKNMSDRYTVNGKTMEMLTSTQITHYHVNIASFIQLGKWFDYLRDNDVYDNTRIIIVSDHGFNVNYFDNKCNSQDMEFFIPLLMVKDFDAKGFKVSEEFMTNADTPTLATEGLIEDPINPFTNNPINSDAKNGPQNVMLSGKYAAKHNDGYAFLPCSWYVIDGNPHKASDWKYAGEH